MHTSTLRRRAWRDLLQAWGPVIALAGLIFVASAQPKLPPSTPTDAVYFTGWMPVFPPPWETIAKKGAHVAEYALLAGLIGRALALYAVRVSHAAPLTAALALGYACTDEWHQAFVTGRNASPRDVAIDAAAALLAIGVWVVWQRRSAGQQNSPSSSGRARHPGGAAAPRTCR